MNIKQIDNIPYVSEKSLAELTNIPREIIKWHATQGVEGKEICEKLICKQGTMNYISAPAILYVMQKAGKLASVKDFHVAADTLRALFSQEDKSEVWETKCNALLDQVNELKACNEMQGEIFAKIFGVPKKAKAAAGTNTTHYKINDARLPELTKEEEAWSKEMHELLNEKATATNMRPILVLKDVYQIMNRKYGIVFEQIKKDLLNRFGLPGNTEITTLRMITYDGEQTRSIFRSVLTDYPNNNH